MMENLVRENIIRLAPYSSARDDFSGKNGVFLDANENPNGVWNRYPDPYQRALKEQLAKRKAVMPEQIFIGNGSDEIIDLLMRLVCEPGVDQIMTFPPTYGMYQVSAGINNVEIIEVPLTSDFQIDIISVKATIETSPELKIIFICSPNNPTANSFDDIGAVCDAFEGLVVVDEAYIDFSERQSFINQLDQYPNLIVSQTFSKALALAAVRIGVAYTSPEIIGWLNRIKPPYNVSGPNQQEALDALENWPKLQEQVKEILVERKQMEKSLGVISFVKQIYPSDANFLLIEVDDANLRYSQLIDEKVIIRNRHKLVENTLRITIGTAEENQILIQKMKELS